jgi:simple sugar transport system permease protein
MKKNCYFILLEVGVVSTEEKNSIDLFNLLYKYGTIFVILATILFFSIFLDNFMKFSNVINIFRSVSIVGLISLAITMSLTVDGLDLSAAAIAGFAAVIAAKFMVIWELGTVPAIIVPILVGVIVGGVNAFFIIKMNISDLLATLSMMFLLTGISVTFQSGTAIYNYMPLPNNQGMAPGVLTDAYLFLGKGTIFRIPVPVIIMLIVALFVFVFLNHTKYGRFFYMIGSNQEAAKLSGIPVKKYKTMAYMMSGFIAAVAGLVLGARMGSGEVSAGDPYLMDSVAAAFIGFSVFGIGRPNALGTILGALLMGTLLNGLVMMNFPYYSQDIVKGIVLILALSLTYYKKKN